jgi:NAD(P)-dependent dehydrogenase (short-subunit alcohol dehydrogenase family)
MPKIAFISGANKGIGFETARQLGQQGITVLLGARDLARGLVAAETLRQEGIVAHAIQFDVLDSAAIKAAVEKIEQEFGVLDILVNNAAILTESLGTNSTLEVSEADLRATFDSNFFAVIAVTNAFLPLLRKSAAGRIVNVSSIVGSLAIQADPASPIKSKTLAYDSSKTALNAYTIHLAAALQDTKIKVNSAHPGWIKTDMGTDAATFDVPYGAKTEVYLATLPEDGPTGGYFHLEDPLPW